MEKQRIEDLRDEFVLCRAIGHAWEDNPTAEVDSQWFRRSAGVLTLRCARCTTERFDYIGLNMKVFQRYYRYPDHYTTIPGEGSRPNLRGEMIRRSLLIRKYGTRKRARA